MDRGWKFPPLVVEPVKKKEKRPYSEKCAKCELVFDNPSRRSLHYDHAHRGATNPGPYRCQRNNMIVDLANPSPQFFANRFFRHNIIGRKYSPLPLNKKKKSVKVVKKKSYKRPSRQKKSKRSTVNDVFSIPSDESDVDVTPLQVEETNQVSSAVEFYEGADVPADSSNVNYLDTPHAATQDLNSLSNGDSHSNSASLGQEIGVNEPLKNKEATVKRPIDLTTSTRISEVTYTTARVTWDAVGVEFHDVDVAYTAILINKSKGSRRTICSGKDTTIELQYLQPASDYSLSLYAHYGIAENFRVPQFIFNEQFRTLCPDSSSDDDGENLLQKAESPVHSINPQGELKEDFKLFVDVAEKVEDNVNENSLSKSASLDADEMSIDTISYDEISNTLMFMDTSYSEAFFKEDDTNYNEVQRKSLKDFFSSSGSQHDSEDETSHPSYERIPLSRFPSIVKAVENAEYDFIQLIYKLLYQRSASDNKEILSKRILEFCGFTFRKGSEEFYNREMMLQTLQNTVLVKIGAILCLDQVRNALSNVGLGRHDLINAIMDFVALPKKKTRASRISNNTSDGKSKAQNVEPCGCRNNCLTKFTEAEREILAKHHAALEKKKADAYFLSLIQVQKSTKRPDDVAKKHRNHKFNYKIKIGRKNINVCKVGFMMLHNVNINRINRLKLKRKCNRFPEALLAAVEYPYIEGQKDGVNEPSKTEDVNVDSKSTTKSVNVVLRQDIDEPHMVEEHELEEPLKNKEATVEITIDSTKSTRNESVDKLSPVLPPFFADDKDNSSPRTPLQSRAQGMNIDWMNVNQISSGTGQSSPDISDSASIEPGIDSSNYEMAVDLPAISSEKGSHLSDETDETDETLNVSFTARSASIKWDYKESPSSYPSCYPDTEFDVHLTSKYEKRKLMYRGTDKSFKLTDLKPATTYLLSVSVCADNKGNDGNDNESEYLLFKTFTTLSCEPDPPQNLQLKSKSETTLSLKWNASVNNGAKILAYILEYDEGNGGDNFVELFNGLQKQFKAVKLKPSTCYRFRLAAINEHGKSCYSEISCFSTTGSAPSQPMPPDLKEASINNLSLEWQSRPNDDNYTLQMEDEGNLFGFITIYDGRDINYTCRNLRPNTSYKFRLCASNNQGASPWSQIVSYKTLPEKRDPPVKKPVLKGRSHSAFFKETPGPPGPPGIPNTIETSTDSITLSWNKPRSDGGSPVTGYVLEKRKIGDDKWSRATNVTVPNLTYRVTGLQDNCQYEFRVAACNAAGQGSWSNISDGIYARMPPYGSYDVDESSVGLVKSILQELKKMKEKKEAEEKEKEKRRIRKRAFEKEVLERLKKLEEGMKKINAKNQMVQTIEKKDQSSQTDESMVEDEEVSPIEEGESPPQLELSEDLESSVELNEKVAERQEEFEEGSDYSKGDIYPVNSSAVEFYEGADDPADSSDANFPENEAASQDYHDESSVLNEDSLSNISSLDSSVELNSDDFPEDYKYCKLDDEKKMLQLPIPKSLHCIKSGYLSGRNLKQQIAEKSKEVDKNYDFSEDDAAENDLDPYLLSGKKENVLQLPISERLKRKRRNIEKQRDQAAKKARMVLPEQRNEGTRKRKRRTEFEILLEENVGLILETRLRPRKMKIDYNEHDDSPS